MFIPIILGTAREGRKSEKAARYMLRETQKLEGVETEILDVRDFPKETSKAFAENMARADALIIVAPEYNHSYPGELKTMLDMAYKEYHRKPIGICGVSMGGLGGARMVEQLRLVTIEFHMVPIREALYFSGIGKLFAEDGFITDESYADRVKAFHEELLWYAKALKHAREVGADHLCSPPGD
jgi:NAD(P)H-dependent FMN reductase